METKSTGQIIKEMLEGVFGDIKVEGEISNLKTASSGHIYFDLNYLYFILAIKTCQ